MAHRAREAGFTLLEMLVTLAIMALVAGIGFPAVQLLASNRALDDAAASVSQAMIQARSQALRSDAAATISFNRLGNALVLNPGRITLPLPQSVGIEMPHTGLTFYPDGSATGGTIRISANAGRRELRIDPQSGALSEPVRRQAIR